MTKPESETPIADVLEMTIGFLNEILERTPAVRLNHDIPAFIQNELNPVMVNARSLERRLREAESKIDALMLEYCPSDMTQEQMDRWGRHQNPVIEAAERGKEGMVQVPKTLTNQMREVLEDPDLESRMPQQIWDYLLSAAEEGK